MSSIFASTAEPGWKKIAQDLRAQISGPTSSQRALAAVLNMHLPSNVPATVAAVILQSRLQEELFQPLKTMGEIPDSLAELEDELGIQEPAQLITGLREEVSAWFAARYMLKTAIGLEGLMPEIGDIVSGHTWSGEKRKISSISSNGKINMSHRPVRRAWPNHLDIVTRIGSAGYQDSLRDVENANSNRQSSTSTNLDNFNQLQKHLLNERVPSVEAVRELQELLESSDHDESYFQKLIERHPALLSCTVTGHWRTYVIPQVPFGGKYVLDYLVLGISSLGPEWLAVEIERPGHRLLLKDDTLAGPVRHAVDGQIQKWRDWLTDNAHFAQTNMGLFGINNRIKGLVIIGRGDPMPERQNARAQSGEQARIDIRTWDWLLRNAEGLQGEPNMISGDFSYDIF